MVHTRLNSHGYSVTVTVDFILGFLNWEEILVFWGSRCIEFLHNDA